MTRRFFIFSCFLLFLTLASCGQQSPDSNVNQAKILAAADAADGSVDTVVHLCAVCSLSMDGDEKFRSHYAGYTFDHCSAHCKETFDYDPIPVIGRLDLGGT